MVEDELTRHVVELLGHRAGDHMRGQQVQALGGELAGDGF